ncbi:MAG: hypothetical protein GWP59_05860 [Chlamydiales bacterium]|nr:hypothetical protein [Chlamydiales bacterium]
MVDVAAGRVLKAQIPNNTLKLKVEAEKPARSIKDLTSYIQSTLFTSKTYVQLKEKITATLSSKKTCVILTIGMIASIILYRKLSASQTPILPKKKSFHLTDAEVKANLLEAVGMGRDERKAKREQTEITAQTHLMNYTMGCHRGKMVPVEAAKREYSKHPLLPALQDVSSMKAAHNLYQRESISHAASYVITRKPDGKLYLLVKSKDNCKIEVPGGYGYDTRYSFSFMLQALRSEMWHEGNVVATKEKTRWTSPPCLTVTDKQKVAMLQVFHFNYDSGWEENLKCHEDPSWKIHLMPLDEVRSTMGELFSADVAGSFTELDHLGVFDYDHPPRYETSHVQLASAIDQEFFSSVYLDLSSINSPECSRIREMARLPEEEFFLLPLEQNEALHKSLLLREVGEGDYAASRLEKLLNSWKAGERGGKSESVHEAAANALGQLTPYTCVLTKGSGNYKDKDILYTAIPSEVDYNALEGMYRRIFQLAYESGKKKLFLPALFRGDIAQNLDIAISEANAFLQLNRDMEIVLVPGGSNRDRLCYNIMLEELGEQELVDSGRLKVEAIDVLQAEGGVTVINAGPQFTSKSQLFSYLEEVQKGLKTLVSKTNAHPGVSSLSPHVQKVKDLVSDVENNMGKTTASSAQELFGDLDRDAFIAAYNDMIETFRALQVKYPGEQCFECSPAALAEERRLKIGSSVNPYLANRAHSTPFLSKMKSLLGFANLVLFGPKIFDQLRAKLFISGSHHYKANEGLNLFHSLTGNMIDCETKLAAPQGHSLMALEEANFHIEAFKKLFAAFPEALRDRRLDLPQSERNIHISLGNTDRGDHGVWFVNHISAYFANVPDLIDITSALLLAPYLLVESFEMLKEKYQGTPEYDKRLIEFFNEAISLACFNGKQEAVLKTHTKCLELVGAILSIKDQAIRDFGEEMVNNALNFNSMVEKEFFESFISDDEVRAVKDKAVDKDALVEDKIEAAMNQAKAKGYLKQLAQREEGALYQMLDENLLKFFIGKYIDYMQFMV